MISDHDRYALTILKSGAVVLRDAELGTVHHFGASRTALFDALGVLADWRERDANGRPRKAVCVHPYASVDSAGHCRDCGSSLTITVTPSCPYDCGHRDCPVHGPEDEARDKAHYGVVSGGIPLTDPGCVSNGYHNTSCACLRNNGGALSARKDGEIDPMHRNPDYVAGDE